VKEFQALNVSSKFAICGLPIRVDTYKNCEFGCTYCFSNNRKICEFDKELQIANISAVEKRLNRIFDLGRVGADSFLDNLIEQRITWHCGGMADPFQPAEGKYHITRNLVDVCNRYGISILFSTKTDNIYDADVRPDLHTFQLSVSNVYNRRDIEPNVPNIEKRLALYKQLKSDGFRVGIRLQPFIPGVSTLDIIKMFSDADQFTIEGLKLVPQNKEHKELVLNALGLNREDFVQMGLLNMKPEIRMELYRPFIEYFNEKGIPFSIADNDMHQIGTNRCCCGDRLVVNSTTFNSTAMCKFYGPDYCKEQLDYEVFKSGVRDCRCNHLFTSNRQEGCVSVQDFYDKRFYRATSPFSPEFLVKQYPAEWDEHLKGEHHERDFVSW
jgi:DNA repair photolyase